MILLRNRQILIQFGFLNIFGETSIQSHINWIKYNLYKFFWNLIFLSFILPETPSYVFLTDMVVSRSLRRDRRRVVMRIDLSVAEGRGDSSVRPCLRIPTPVGLLALAGRGV